MAGSVQGYVFLPSIRTLQKRPILQQARDQIIRDGRSRPKWFYSWVSLAPATERSGTLDSCKIRSHSDQITQWRVEAVHSSMKQLVTLRDTVGVKPEGSAAGPADFDQGASPVVAYSAPGRFQTFSSSMMETKA